MNMKAIVFFLLALFAISAVASTQQSACSVCHLIVQVAENYISSNQSVQALEARLDTLCNDLPSPYNGECTLLVATYLPKIVQFVIMKESPSRICIQIHACSPQINLKRAVEQSPCSICQLVVNMAESYLANNMTVTQLEQKLDSVCNDLPQPYAGSCVLIVNAYLPQIIHWIQTNEPPETICAQLDLCSSALAKSAMKVNAIIARKVDTAPKLQGATTCSLCELIARVAEGFVVRNESVTKMEAALDKVCSKLPSHYATECTQLVNTYLPQIIVYLKNKEPPAKICAQLKLCSSLKRSVEAVQQSPCAVCELVVQMAENFLAQNATQQQIEAKLDSLCERLPSPFGSECDLIVAAYLPEIIRYIETNEQPATFCAQIGLCSSVKKLVALRKPKLH